MTRGRLLVRPETTIVPPGNVTAAEWTSIQDGIATINPGRAGSPNEVLAHTPTGPRWVKGPINAAAFGMHPDNTALENKLALEAAIDSGFNRVWVYIPHGYYLIENLKQFNRTVSLIGAGRGYPDPQAAYGGAQYSNMSSYMGGTTLAVTSTTGNFLDVNILYHYGNAVNLEKIAIVGIGDATRTNTAVMMGSQAAPTRWPLSCVWNDVLICNFYRGAMVEHMQWGRWSAVEFRGCRQAAHFANQCNQNTFDQTLLALCGDVGVTIFDVERSELNSFGSMCFQSNIGGIVFRLRDYSLNNHIGDIYSENPSDGPEIPFPITYAIDVTANSTSNKFGIVQLMVTEDKVRVAGHGNEMTIGDRSVGTVTDTGVDNRWDIYDLAETPFTTNWPGNVRTRQYPKFIGAAHSPYTPTLNDSAIFADTSGGNVTVALPPVATQKGRRIIIHKTTTGNSVVIDPSGAEMIDTTATVTLTAQSASREIICDGSRWRTIASHL